MINPDLTREAYDRLEAWNFSRLRVLAKTPRHFAHAVKYGSTDSAARKFGRIVHLAVLEPEAFEDRIAVWTKKTDAGAVSPRRGKEWEAFKAAHGGKELILEEERDEAMAIANALHEDEHAAPLLSGGRAEVTLSWQFGSFGLKCRLDLITPTHIVELKKTRSAAPLSFAWDAEAYCYHAQAAWQIDGHMLSAGRPLSGYRMPDGTLAPHVIVAVEDAAPYVSQVYAYGEAELEAGREEYQRWLAILEDCQRTRTWRGYADGPVPLGLPRRARAAEHGEAA